MELNRFLLEGSYLQMPPFLSNKLTIVNNKTILLITFI